MPDSIWYVGVRGERKGPFSEDDIKGMIQKGEVSPRDVVWKEGLDNWKPVIEVEPFIEIAKSVPAPPPALSAGPNPFLIYVQDVWANLKAILFNPEQGLDSVADKKPLCFSLIWIVLGIILFGLFVIQCQTVNAAGTYPNMRVNPITVLAVGLAPATGIGLFFKALLYGLIKYAIAFGVLMLALVPILRSKATWIDALSILGLSSIPTVIIGLLAFIFLWIDPFFAIFLAPALVCGLLVFAHVFQHTSQLSKRVTLLAVPAVYFATYLVFSLLMLIK
jgi:hypothetical protein